MRIIRRSSEVKCLKDLNNGSLDEKIWETEFDVAEITDGILSKTQSVLGSYLSAAFGYVKNLNLKSKRMNKYSDRGHVSSLN